MARTFNELYNETPTRSFKNSKSPKRDFVIKVAKIGGVQPKTVMGWLYQGTRPNRKTREILSAYFGTKSNELFDARL